MEPSTGGLSSLRRLRRLVAPAKLSVLEAASPSPRWRTIRLGGPALRGAISRPGDAMAVKTSGGWRHYSLAAANPTQGWVDLAVYLHHQGGPGATWATEVAVGDQVTALGPASGLGLDEAATGALFIGDATSLPSFSMLAAAAPRVPAVAVLADPGELERRGLPGHVEVRWLGTPEARPTPEEHAAAAVEALRSTDLGSRPALYASGEVAVLQAARVAVGLPKGQTHVHAHWTTGKAGL